MSVHGGWESPYGVLIEVNPERILVFDRYLGRPLCAALSAFDWLRRGGAAPRKTKPRRILFIKLVEMGSTVLACPAFAEAVRMVGRENVFILVFSENRAIVDVLPFFRPENVLTVEHDSFAIFARDMRRTLARIRAEKIDTAIDLEGLTRASAAITYLTGAVNRVGYYNFTSEGPFRGRLFTHELNYGFHHHVAKTFLGMVRSLEAPPNGVPLLKLRIDESDLALPAFVPSEAETETMTRLLAPIRPPSGAAGPLVLMNPNCSDLLPLRRWPDQSFIELAHRFLKEVPGCSIAITGAKAEVKGAEALAAAIGRPAQCMSVAGRTTFRELLALYCQSQLLISNDSGPCHFACLTPVGIVSLFGPETPTLYAPLGSRAVSISARLSCSPCVSLLNHRFSPCQENLCMSAITVDEVFAQSQQLLVRLASR